MENITDKTRTCPDCGKTRKVKRIIAGFGICNDCQDKALRQILMWRESPDFKKKMDKALEKLT